MVDGDWICSSCGATNPEGTRFCGHCGTPSGALADPAAARPPTPAAADDHQRISEVLKSFVAGSVAERIVESGGDLGEERRLVTALFADLSGFTALAGRLDPESLLEIIDPRTSGQCLLRTDRRAARAASRPHRPAAPPG